MANQTRILFVSGEVAPFARITEISQLVRTLPERLQEQGDYEMRILMPRYGKVSERRNRLHEVIRLSGTEIPVGKEKDTLKVKVASIPGIRLQVYFMDSARYFKRKSYFADNEGQAFQDNPERALFFARSVLKTMHNLGWQPDVVHTFGWISSFVPMLLRTEFASDPLFEQAKGIYTPDSADMGIHLDEEKLKQLQLPTEEKLTGMDLNEVGRLFSDAVVYGPWHTGSTPDAFHLNGSHEEITEQAISIYSQVVKEGNVLA